MRTYLVGRSPYADIVVADPTVAEHHAEIVITEDGRIFVVDCGTAAGTWRLIQDGNRPTWKVVRQEFVTRDDVLRLGDNECLVAELLSTVLPQPQAETGGGGIRAETARRGGRVRRDPMTGEIVQRRI